ncbi:hypothetical protein CEXT_600431 [Caerostris extrusa]|uniref:Transposase n=1 Tax=Caerostris extrusa TaxID=172846 RepID=A0AAV4XT57_CAEEX|nr:hypothetical protein CEXT_600431 [Caerostris extrusa]
MDLNECVPRGIKSLMHQERARNVWDKRERGRADWYGMEQPAWVPELFKIAEQRLATVHCQLAIVKRFVLKYGFKSNAECVRSGIKSLMNQRHARNVRAKRECGTADWYWYGAESPA